MRNFNLHTLRGLHTDRLRRVDNGFIFSFSQILEAMSDQLEADPLKSYFSAGF
jgi:hypothetical protein